METASCMKKAFSPFLPLLLLLLVVVVPFLLAADTVTERPDVLKCCKSNQVFVNKKCKNSTEYKSDRYNLVSKRLNCSSGQFLLELSTQISNDSLTPEAIWSVNKTGWLVDELEQNGIAPGQFCLEQFLESNTTNVYAVVCSTDTYEPKNNYAQIGMMISLPFLLFTLFVFLFTRELRNLHGKALMCYIASLLVAYSTSVFEYFINEDPNESEYCVILAYIRQFTFMASFFWLNVMCFDLWWTFSGSRQLRRNSKKNEANNFLMYSIYAWGFTALISILTFYMDFLYTMIHTNISSEITRPEFGVNNECWFNSKKAMLIYFYGPVGILLFSNLLMFVHTTKIIVKQMRDAKSVLRGTESNKNVKHERQRFMLYLKLFIVMGVNWLAEIVSWALDSNSTHFVVWDVLDFGNSFQGVLIFIIFICKRRVLKLFIEQLCPQCSIFQTRVISSTRTTNRTISSISSNTNNEYSMEINN